MYMCMNLGGSGQRKNYPNELYSAEYRCMVKVCAPCVGQCRVYMYITKMTWTRANFTSLFCTASLLSVVCCAAQERQKAFRRMLCIA